MDTESQKRDGVRYIEVVLGYEDQRIDNFLIRELKGVPLSHIYRILRKGEVRVNKKRIKQTYRLQLGDVVRIPPISTGPKSIPPDPSRFQYLKDRVVYEDETLIILNKPQGLAVHEGSNIQSGLIEALRVVYPEFPQLELVHRLDKETSGLIMIAKSRSTMKLLHDMLRNREIKKTYQAVVVGRWPKGLNKVDLVLEGDKESVTTFQILEYRAKTTLIEAHPLTGRTHQIRLHCQASGYPIVGDPLYGDATFDRLNDSPRMYLHAAQLKLTHPKTGKLIHVKAESGF
jgi:23S rRNA pseudouridine955/2504/2580 synthase